MNRNRKLRMGMIGGSKEAFNGAVHRMAVAIDGQIELVCGAFSSDPNRSAETGKFLFLPQERVYGSFEQMIFSEKHLSEDIRMDFVSIVTPNFLHFAPCKLALENGFHVMCEKPLSLNVEEAEIIKDLVNKTGLIFALTHNYTAYPMVKQAREIIKSKQLGEITKVIAEYQQGWLSQKIELDGQKQALWRTDPAKAGISCCVADIGTHAENLTEYITGLTISELCADISSFVEGRELEDDANILLRFSNGAKGAILVSQVATGEENELKIRVYGRNGHIQWLQSDPNNLILKLNESPIQILRPGNSYLGESAKNNTRLPSGHPEGYLESLANLYKEFGAAVLDHQEDIKNVYDFPTVDDGLKGMKFISAVIESGKQNASWVKP